MSGSEGTNSPMVAAGGILLLGIVVVFIVLSVAFDTKPPEGTCEALGKATEFSGSNRLEEAAKAAAVAAEAGCTYMTK